MDIEAEQSDKMEKEEVHLVNFSEIVGDMDGVNINLPQENISDSDYFSYNINCFNSTPVCFTKIMELYASKTRHKSKEKTILDQDAIDLPQLSPYELMLRLLLRLSYRFSHEEVDYLEEITGAPVTLFNSDGKDNKWLSVSSCQKLIRQWKNARTPDNPICTDQELEKLSEVSQGILNEDPKKVEDIIGVYFSVEKLSKLPYINGCIPKTDGSFLAYPITLDTAASSSIMPYSLFKKLGYSKDYINKEREVSISTACSTSTKALGYFQHKIYLRDHTGNCYSLPVNFLVLGPGGGLNKCLLGIVDLRSNGGVHDMSKVPSGGPEKYLLTVKNKVGKEVRKSFITLQPEGEIDLSLADPKNVPLIGQQEIPVQYISTDFMDMSAEYLEKKNIFYSSITMTDRHVGYETINNVKWPTDIVFGYSIVCSSPRMAPAKRSIRYRNEQKIQPQNINEVCERNFSQFQEAFVSELNQPKEPMVEEDSDEQEFAPMEPLENLPQALDVDEFLLDNLNLGPLDVNLEDPDKWYLCDVSHLPPYWQSKYEALFYYFRNTFARSKFDFTLSKLPEVDLEVKEGCEPPFDPVRRFGELEMRILDDYLSGLERSGHIQKLGPHETARANHNLLLVYRQDKEIGQQFVSSKADKLNMSMEERMELLRASSRLCSDLRNLNSVLTSSGQMYLAKLEEILPAFSKRKLSSLDIKSGFNMIKLSYSASLLTCFVHRASTWRYVSLPQGCKNSPERFSQRLELCLNELNYNSFSQHVNQSLLNRQESNLLLYDWRKEYDQQYSVKPGECKCQNEKNKNTCVCISTPYTVTDNQLETCKTFYEHIPVLQDGFNADVFKYLDDITPCTRDLLNHYYVIFFILYWFDQYSIKLNSSKVQLLSSKIQFLGFAINVEDSRWGLTVSRRRNFQSWSLPTSKLQLASRLCSLTYFSDAIFCFKLVTQCLHALSTAPVFHLRKVHAIEFQLLKFCLDLNITYHIIDLTRPLFCQSDASFSVCSGAMLQTVTHPSDPEITELGLVAQFSKRYKKGDGARSPLVKEVIGLVTCIREYELFFRNCSSFVLVWSDASSLSYITRQKFINSRLYHVSLFLSSFQNLFLKFSPGSKGNFLTDALSRAYGGIEIKDPSAIPSKLLEHNPQLNLEGLIITPRVLNQVMLSSCPRYFTEIPERRKQAFSPLMGEEELRKLINNQPNIESQFLTAVLHGYAKIPPDSLCFAKPDYKSIISRSDYEAMMKKCDQQGIRTLFDGYLSHSVHLTTFSDIHEQMKQWVSLLKQFMERENFCLIESSLYQMCNTFLQKFDVDIQFFRSLILHYQKSSLYNTVTAYPEAEFMLFIMVGLYISSDIQLSCTDGNLILSSCQEIKIEPGESINLKVGLVFMTKYSITLEPSNKNLIFHPVYKLSEQLVIISHIIIMNPDQNGESQSLCFNQNQNMFRVLIHVERENECSCLKQQNFKYIFHSLKSLDDIEGPSENIQILLSELLSGPRLNARVKWQCKGQSLGEMARPRPDYKRGNYSDSHLCQALFLTQTHDGVERIPEPDLNISLNKSQPSLTPDQLNRIILMGLCMTRKSVFSATLIRNLQDQCPILSKIKKKLKENGQSNSQFSLNEGILFKTKLNKHQKLCLDSATCRALCRNMHAAGKHYSRDFMYNFLNSYFFSYKMKQIVADEESSCGICHFSLPCKRMSYILNPQENPENLRIWSHVAADLDESFHASGSKYRYLVLYADWASGFLVGHALRDTSAKELCQSFKQLLASYGPMQVLKSDFGPNFRSKDFRDLLSEWNIVHSKTSPKRSQSSGQIESLIKIFRQSLTKIIVHEAGDDMRNWQSYLYKALIFFNASSMLGNASILSRTNLFFSHHRFHNSWLISALGENVGSDDLKILQQSSMYKIYEAREKSRQFYSTEDNPYLEGQYLLSPLSKGEKAVAGSKISIQNIYKCIEPLRGSCKVESLLDGSEAVITNDKLRLLPTSELFHLHGKVLKDKGSFDRGLFKMGAYNNQLFQQLESDELLLWPGAGQDHNQEHEVDIQGQDEVPDDGDGEGDVEEHGDAPKLPDLPEVQEGEEPDGGRLQQDLDPVPHDQDGDRIHDQASEEDIIPQLSVSTPASHGYNLRNRPNKRVLCVEHTPLNGILRKNGQSSHKFNNVSFRFKREEKHFAKYKGIYEKGGLSQSVLVKDPVPRRQSVVRARLPIDSTISYHEINCLYSRLTYQ